MKFALIGYGRMGKAIDQIISAGDGTDEVVLRINSGNITDLTIENLRKADVAIEFSRPETVVNNILLCFKAGVPVVAGTTAWLDKFDAVKQECCDSDGALFVSPNFSIGVNIFFEVNRKLAEIMAQQSGFDVQITEIHHTEKLDTPSGTAIRTAELLLSELGRKNRWRLNNGAQEAETDASTLLITAKREPGVPGTHIVTYSSDTDEIQLTHRAKTRRGFAEGAIMAARWLIGRKGVFEMKDLLLF